MEIDSSDGPDWLLDYSFLEDISILTPRDFPLPDLSTIGLSWPSEDFNGSPPISVDAGYTSGNSEGLKEPGLHKGFNSVSSPSVSKACREKSRRNRLNERFQELVSLLEPVKPSRSDKAAILSDAVRMVTQLRREAQKLTESIEDMRERIKELKTEKIELRDEKQMLKAEKEMLKEQIKALNAPPGLLPYHSGIVRASAPAGQIPENKSVAFVSQPQTAMWRFMSPAVVDTSQDHVLRPPVA